MAEYSFEHHKHHEKGSHGHHSNHGNRNDTHRDNDPDDRHDNNYNQEDQDHYSNYGLDYGERARRILEASNHSSSTFKTVGHNHQGANTLQPGTDRLQARRHSMFVDTTSVRLHHDITPIRNIKQMHMDDIVLAYAKKHPHDKNIGHADTSHDKRLNETDNHSRTRSAEANKQSQYIDRTKIDIRSRHEHAHRSEQKYHSEAHSKSLANHKDDHSSDNFNSRFRDLHLTDRYHGKHQGDHGRSEHRRSSDIDARIGMRSPTVIGGHYVTRANGYKHELSSPELERFRANRDRESNAKEVERHTLAQVITDACRRRHERQDHGHNTRRNSGHDAIRNDNMDMPVAGARRHTLASTTGKELQHRHRHSRKNREDTVTVNEPSRGHDEHDRHSTRSEKHHGSHDDVISSHAHHRGDFLATPQITERRHSWTNISSHAH